MYVIMKKRYFIVMLIVLMFSLSVVSASENISNSDNNVGIDEGCILSENQDFTDILSEESDINENNSNGDIESKVIIEANDLTANKGNDTLEFRLLNENNTGIANAEANIAYNTGFVDKATTNDLGIARYDLGLNEGDWAVTISYGGQSATVKVKILAADALINDTEDTNSSQNTTPQNDTPIVPAIVAKVVTKNLKSTYGNKVKYTVQVLDKKGKSIQGVNVTVTLGSKIYVLTTDSEGSVGVYLNCKAGTYKIFYSVGKFKGSNTYTVTNDISLTILQWGLKGNVAKQELIKNNMPNNKWVKKAVKATKKGIPLLKIKGGSGKVVFMTAGVHGNEISSQVAAMKMIDYLTTHPIKGTVYIIPFVNVKAISKKVRYTDKDFNRIADKQGTIPNKIVNLVVSCNASAYGDFHTTKPGGAPGLNIVMGSKSSLTDNAKMIKYIAKKSKVNKRTYSYIGKEYPGGLFECVHKNGIPGVICEVVLPHNTITKTSINTSYKMMKYFLKYNAVI